MTELKNGRTKEIFTLYLEESIMFTTIFSLALRKAGTKVYGDCISHAVGMLWGDWRACCNKRKLFDKCRERLKSDEYWETALLPYNKFVLGDGGSSPFFNLIIAYV